MSFKIISIEGNIGSGKSTLLKYLKNHYQDNSHIVFLREPVDEWEKIKGRDGKSMVQKFYEDQSKYSFSFQMMAYISRLKIIRDAISENKNKNIIIITERSLYTDKLVFAKMLSDQNKIEDVNYRIYLNWFDEFAKDYPIEAVIYVQTDPKICFERINKRSRVGEEKIPLQYLEECHKYHQDFLSGNSEFKTNKSLLFNGNLDIYENNDVLNSRKEMIDQLINNL